MARRPIILLVEDDPGTRQLMATLLDAEGYLVQTAGNGLEALALLQTEVPCAMVVDLDMPVMDGAELRRHQQDIPAVSSVPFILVSGAPNAEGIARELGIAAIVTKPFDEAQLLRIIAAACRRLD
jgi:CheY-like chemotaxis protein